jgi:hypothetical protein
MSRLAVYLRFRVIIKSWFMSEFPNKIIQVQTVTLVVITEIRYLLAYDI